MSNSKLWAKAMKLISLRPHSSHELLSKLNRAAFAQESRAKAHQAKRWRASSAAGADSASVARVALGPNPDDIVSALKETNAINDVEFTEWFVRSRQGWLVY